MSSKKKNDCEPNAISCAMCGAQSQNIICATSPGIPEALEKSKINCRYKRDQVIFYADNDPLGLFFVQRGLVKLERVSEDGAAHTLRIVGPGGILGYRSLFADEAYHATAIAVDEVELCFVPKADILNVFKSHPDVALRLLNHVAKDLRLAEERWVDQMDKGAPERIAEALIFLQDHFHSQTWTRREIAEWAGTTPETVMRTLAQFEKEGLIDQSGRQIQILNKDSLKAKASL
ncbi:Crp/Fnr family transcriptional regulator [Bdellovibrio sp. HCB337]|uniref:Crp/Fnr family transcriptional regulator n=1 Tax=Bdellovibrio sp. HCB337 TaxID=3394358 RepID=UPI0039A70C8F